MFYSCVHRSGTQLFRGGNAELSAGAPVSTHYEAWQKLALTVPLTWNCFCAGKKRGERKEQTSPISPRA